MRVFHPVNPMLTYWEEDDYEILWITLTTAPKLDDADRLADNHRRLRQHVYMLSNGYPAREWDRSDRV